VKPDGTQLEYTEGTTGAEFGMVGEKYGWMVELIQLDQNFASQTHCLGRFRHGKHCYARGVREKISCLHG
jgi:secreted PhoX family phosphatase